MARRAFTLVELLVVIAIIALLVSIMLPSLARARDLARSAQCRSNLYHIAAQAHVYTQDTGRYPVSYWMGVVNGQYVSLAWDFSTIKDWSANPPTTRVMPGVLWQGQNLSQIQQCPSYAGADNWLADPYTGYNYNTSYIGHGSGESDPMPVTVEAVRDPAGTALFGDGEYAGGANKCMRSPWPSPGDAAFWARHAGTQGFRHLGATNVSFCDGHAESMSTRYTDTIPEAKDGIGDGTGFLSPDNSLYDLE